MKRLLIIFLLFPIVVTAQNNFFWPDGSVFKTAKNNIASHLDSLGISLYHTHIYKQTVIFYYPISDKPAFILSDNKVEIKEALKSYSHAKYINSDKYKPDIQEFIEKQIYLDSLYALKYLGEPSTRAKGNTDNQTIWTYINNNLKLYFTSNLATNYKVINYSTIKKNQVIIFDFFIDGTGNYDFGFKASIYNGSPKTIKYVWFTTKAYNAVEDVIATKVAKGVGPIYPDDIGAYTFTDVYFSKVLNDIDLTGLKIQYIDGTFKTIPANEVRKLIVYTDDEF